MFEFTQAIPFSFAALFPVLNPLGSAFIFLSIAGGLSSSGINKLAIRVAVNTFVLLVVVLFTGSWILRFFGITIPIVQVGGGMVVSYIAWTLLNQSSKSTSNASSIINSEKEVDDMAFFPLTMPITAGPGCIAVMLAVSAHEVVRKSFILTLLGQLGVVVGTGLLALSVYFCYRYAARINVIFGKSGTQVIIRLAAFVNLCIGLQIIWHGLSNLGL